ncbi:uncharacterized protein LOC114245622 [Bombyx mandarina]|uniref:Uncharacterized protein n=2 Tax=Bombyx TaxID=7090 RepID=A0A8R2GD03_BOMMO|nr:uncharacterized protein LOC101741987 [Bombyx mori]XP_028033659.1 uncharacterized protein LOC114245622 [Bombyx mandarina]
MLSPQEQQIGICLLKFNLEDIENELVVQRSALPALDAENEQKYRETMTVLKVARSLNNETERLKLENVRLTAKRMQLKRQCEDISKSLETAQTNRNHLKELIMDEENETEKLIRQYEDSLREKADRFRNTRGYYNEDEVTSEYNNVISSLNDLQLQHDELKSTVEELKRQLQAIVPEIPDDILNIVGKTELAEKIKELTEKCATLTEHRNQQRSLQKDPIQSILLKF